MKASLPVIVFALFAIFSCTKTDLFSSSISVNPKSITLSGNKGVIDSFFVDFDGSWAIVVEPFYPDWISLTETGGIGKRMVYVTTESSNLTGKERSIIVTVIPDGDVNPATIKITQTTYIFQPYEKTYGYFWGDTFEESVLDPTGGHISVGSFHDALFSSIVWVSGFSIDGNKRWDKKFGYGATNNSGNSIISLADGNFLITGITQGGDNDLGVAKGGTDLFILKIDREGNKIWSKRYGGSKDEGGNSLIPTSDGNFIVAGMTSSFDGDVNNQHGIAGQETSDAWILKVDGTGKIIWQKCYGSSGKENATGICLSGDGGYIVASYTDGAVANGDLTTPAKLVDFWILKLNATGSIQWQRNCGGSSFDLPNAVIPAIDNGFIIAGHSASTDGTINLPKGKLDGYVVKIASNGTIIWNRNFGTAQDDYLNTIAVSGNNYIAAGAVTKQISNDLDGWQFKLDLAGNLLKETIISHNDFDEFNHVLGVGGGHMLLTGYSYSTDIPNQINMGSKDGFISIKKD